MSESSKFEAGKTKSLKIKPLPPEKLRWTCPPSFFKFKTTEEIEPLDKIVGQPRAVEAIKLGAELFAKGYNVFVTGLSGTGRLTTVKKVLEDVAKVKLPTYDYCYVNNFSKPDEPRLIKLKAGEGKAFSKAMDEAISYLRKKLPSIFDDPGYKSARNKIIEDYQKKERGILEKFDEKIRKEGFVRGQIETPQGIAQPEIFPIIDGKPTQIEELEELAAEKKIKEKDLKRFYDKYKKFKRELSDLARVGLKMMQDFKKAMFENDKAYASLTISAVLDDVVARFDNAAVSAFAGEVKEYIEENLSLFIGPSNPTETPPEVFENNAKELFKLFKVNVILDNSKADSPPIVIETNPTYTNLFGTIERSYDPSGGWQTDFTKIKAGSILRADNGYLIVNALDLFSEAGVWPALKRVLLYNKLEIQPYEAVFQLSQLHLKPEPIEVNVKVIIIGGQTLYRWLYLNEKGFKKIFKVQAQFDYETKRTPAMMNYYARFVAKIGRESGAPRFSPEAVAALVEWAAEKAGSQNRVTLKFSDVADVAREAAYYRRFRSPKKNGAIEREDVEKAIAAQRYRNNLLDEKLKEEILNGDIKIDITGAKVGQINGLTILDTGVIMFGKPARITATVSAGEAGIINVEREADMSGNIHNKAILIITGFLNEKFAKERPLSLTATIAFEQNYGGIDGDSASAAEIYVLLSAITGVPIRQSLAITGSVDQKGNIQPIGGVNEKIRGFYEICKEKNFPENCGVIVPKQNVKDLMLPKEIIEDAKKGRFSVYSIQNIDDAVELLMGIKPGKPTKDGGFSKGSLYDLTARKLEELRESAKKTKKRKKEKSSKTSKDRANEDEVAALREALKIEALINARD